MPPLLPMLSSRIRPVRAFLLLLLPAGQPSKWANHRQVIVPVRYQYLRQGSPIHTRPTAINRRFTARHLGRTKYRVPRVWYGEQMIHFIAATSAARFASILARQLRPLHLAYSSPFWSFLLDAHRPTSYAHGLLKSE
ncbi:hypothetical protein EV126DRAFT_49676 [Verticillium dahliae]|nr:hypothetical protein EV126DRAFT_49676 [Verticillium dahliae]